MAICVAGGYTEDEDGKTGFVIFTNQNLGKLEALGLLEKVRYIWANIL